MRRFGTVFGALVFMSTAACSLLQSGPTDKEVTAAVEKTPPSPPTAGPTFLAEVTSVKIEERGRYNGEGKYWPIRIRVKGAARSKLSPLLSLTLADAVQRETPQPDAVHRGSPPYEG